MTEERIIQGKEADSTEEWYVSIALSRLKIPYVYQLPLFGGYGVRGGMIVDFLIENPFPQALEVMGEYWHQGEMKARDRLRIAILNAYFKRETIILWGSELETVEQAITAVRKKV